MWHGTARSEESNQSKVTLVIRDYSLDLQMSGKTSRNKATAAFESAVVAINLWLYWQKYRNQNCESFYRNLPFNMATYDHL